VAVEAVVVVVVVVVVAAAAAAVAAAVAAVAAAHPNFPGCPNYRCCHRTDCRCPSRTDRPEARRPAARCRCPAAEAVEVVPSVAAEVAAAAAGAQIRRNCLDRLSFHCCRHRGFHCPSRTGHPEERHHAASRRDRPAALHRPAAPRPAADRCRSHYPDPVADPRQAVDPDPVAVLHRPAVLHQRADPRQAVGRSHCPDLVAVLHRPADPRQAGGHYRRYCPGWMGGQHPQAVHCRCHSRELMVVLHRAVARRYYQSRARTLAPVADHRPNFRD
jgi:hypothetical protein